MDSATALSQKLDRLRCISDNREVNVDDTKELNKPAETRKATTSQEPSSWGASGLNPLAAASKAVTAYAREAAISILPTWTLPTLKDSLNDVSLEHLVRLISLTYKKDPSLGTIQAHKSVMDGFVRDQQMLLPRAARSSYMGEPVSNEFGYSISALPGAVTASDEQLQNMPLRARVIVETFRAEGWKFFELKQQEQLFEAADIFSCWYQPINASELDPSVTNPLPFPQMDIYPRLLLLLTLVSMKVKLSEGFFAFFLSPRVVDMVESLFWLVHSVVFSPKSTSVPASEVMRTMHPDLYSSSRFCRNTHDGNEDSISDSRVEQSADSTLGGLLPKRPSYADPITSSNAPPSRAVLGLDGRVHYKPLRLPPHLRPMELNLNSQDYLRNRFVDAFVAIERNWIGCRSSDKEKVVEILPYVISSAVVRGFFRCFPVYSHIFSVKFRLSIYENIIYYLTGVPPYIDILQDIRKSYFPTEPHTVESFLQYFPKNTATLINVQTINGYSSSKDLMLGRYRNFSYTPFVDNLLVISKSHDRTLRTTCTVGEQAAAKESALKPIEFDIVLFPEAELNTDFLFNVSQSAIRNRSVSPVPGMQHSHDASLRLSEYSNERSTPSTCFSPVTIPTTVVPHKTEGHLAEAFSVESKDHNDDSLSIKTALSTNTVENANILVTATKRTPHPSYGQSGLSQLNAEEVRVNKHKIVKSTLPQLGQVDSILRRGRQSCTSKTEDRLQPASATASERSSLKKSEDINVDAAIEKVSTYGVSSLETIPELKRASVSSIVLRGDIMGEDPAVDHQQPAQPGSLHDLLKAHGAEAVTVAGSQLPCGANFDSSSLDIHQKTHSMTVDNTFLIRLNQKLHIDPSPKIEGILGTELVTSGDVVLVENGEEYMKHVNNAMNDAMHPESFNHTLRGNKSFVKTGPSASPSPSRAGSPVYRAEQIMKLLPRTTDTSRKDTIEKLLGNPLGVAHQKIATTRVTPVMVRYLTITGVPAASDFSSYIKDSAFLDPSLGQSDALKRIANRRAGQPTQTSNAAIDKEISIVRRTRNDPWSKADVISYETGIEKRQFEAPEDSEVASSTQELRPTIKSEDITHSSKGRVQSPVRRETLNASHNERLSPNRFHLQYEAAKRKLKRQAVEDAKKHKAEMVELEIQKELFLNKALKGGVARTAALSRALVEGDAKDKKQGEKGFISYHSKDNAMVAFLTFRSELQKNLHDLEVAEQLSQKVRQREEARKAMSRKMQANEDSLKLLAKKAEAPLVLWPINPISKSKTNDSATVEVNIDGRGADLRELDFQSYQDIARGEVSSGSSLDIRNPPRLLTKISRSPSKFT